MTVLVGGYVKLGDAKAAMDANESFIIVDGG